jgi:hypothetical protein
MSLLFAAVQEPETGSFCHSLRAPIRTRKRTYCLRWAT